MNPRGDPTQTRERLLEAAQELMLERGYGATSVDQICARAGVTKGSFFHHFESKEALGGAVLDHFAGAMYAMMEAALGPDLGAPRARLGRYLDFFRAFVRAQPGPPSCLVGNLTQELAATNPALRARCEANFGRWIDRLAAEIALAKDACAPCATFEPRSVAEHFLVTLEGALVLAKARGEAAVILDHVDHFERYLDALLRGSAGADAPSAP